MSKKENVSTLLLKTTKTLVVFFTLSAIGWFVEILPFAQSLPFLSSKLPIGVFLSSVISLLMLIVLVVFGTEAAPAVDGLLDFMPKAGSLFKNLVKIGAGLFAYYSFQPAVLPFIPEFEWAYQAAFLGLILFFLVRVGLIVYAGSEDISRFLLGFLNPYRPAPEAKGIEDAKAAQPPN
jgi:hypothetical protein